jgi:RNA polymerase sigma-70 factor, ECF subfamily
MSDQMSPQEAIASLYSLYAHDVFRYARFSLGNDSDAYDVVQETFFKAFQSWQTFRGDAHAKTWLMKIARNHIYDFYRKQGNKRKYESTLALPDVEDLGVNADDLLALSDALAHLPDNYRQVIVLRYVHRLSIQECSEVLAWSSAKVSTTAHRAVNKLRDILSIDEKGGSGFDQIRK